MVSLSVLALLTRVIRLKDVRVEGESSATLNSVLDFRNSSALELEAKE